MKNKLLPLLMLLASAALASGCMIVSDKAVFKASDKVEMPDLSGAFTDPKEGTFLLSRDAKNTNQFILTAPDKQTMTLVFTPLAGAGRYVVQVANPAGPEVLLGLCALGDQSVDIYALKPAALAPLTKKYGLTIDERGFMTQKPSDRKLLEFFNECFDAKYSERATSIRPGGGEAQNPPEKSGRRRNQNDAQGSR